jgi:hypothetical protein
MDILFIGARFSSIAHPQSLVIKKANNLLVEIVGKFPGKGAS